MKFPDRTLRVIVSITVFIGILMVSGCGSGGGAGTTPDMTPPPTDIVVTPAPSLPKISGFDFVLHKGDFWEYGWDYKSSYTAAYGSHSSSAKSKFRITLGETYSAGGVTFYEMLISGNTKSNETGDLHPKAKYLAVTENKIITLGADNVTQKIIFNAQTGLWSGSGFFTTFPSSTLFEGSLSTISNDYINQSAYRVMESASSSQCQYFPGVGNVCGGDYNEAMDEREYYISGVGPAGYYAKYSMSDPSSADGGWWASNTTNIGLVAASLRGDAVDYTLETEPNNKIADATPISIPARIAGDSANETFLGGTSPVSIGLSLISEVEPNNSPFVPQNLTIPTLVSGNVLAGDANTPVSGLVVPGSSSYTATFEDWYKLTLATAKTVNIELKFPGTGADLDMFLFSLESSNAVTTQSSSVGNNIASGAYSEKISKYLSAGTYYVAVDGYLTPVRANYKLGIATADSVVNIGDWFKFTLANETKLAIKVTGGPSFVLTDETGANTLASGSTAGASVTLVAGSYLVGVSEGGAYILEVASP